MPIIMYFLYIPIYLILTFALTAFEAILYIVPFVLFIHHYIPYLFDKGIRWKTANYFQKTCILFFVLFISFTWICIFLIWLTM